MVIGSRILKSAKAVRRRVRRVASPKRVRRTRTAAALAAAVSEAHPPAAAHAPKPLVTLNPSPNFRVTQRRHHCDAGAAQHGRAAETVAGSFEGSRRAGVGDLRDRSHRRHLTTRGRFEYSVALGQQEGQPAIDRYRDCCLEDGNWHDDDARRRSRSVVQVPHRCRRRSIDECRATPVNQADGLSGLAVADGQRLEDLDSQEPFVTIRCLTAP